MAGSRNLNCARSGDFSFGQRCKIVLSDGADGRGELLAAAKIVVLVGIEGGTFVLLYLPWPVEQKV